VNDVGFDQGVGIYMEDDCGMQFAQRMRTRMCPWMTSACWPTATRLGRLLPVPITCRVPGQFQ